MTGFGSSSFPPREFLWNNLIGDRNASALRLASLSTAWFPPAPFVWTHLLVWVFMRFANQL